MSVTAIVVIVIAVIVVLALVAFFNSFIAKRNMADQAFSTIDVMLKKRCDLVPNLVASVQQYMKHESATLTRIAELRARAGDSKTEANQRLAADGEMNRLIGNLMVQVEQYPELKADTHIHELNGSLSGMEEQISASRRTFNAAVTSFNNSVDMFPGNLFAGLFGFKRRALLETSPEDRRVPDVKALFKD